MLPILLAELPASTSPDAAAVSPIRQDNAIGLQLEAVGEPLAGEILSTTDNTIAQTPADLQRQAEAERAYQDAQRALQESRNNQQRVDTPQTRENESRANEAVERIRNSGGDINTIRRVREEVRQIDRDNATIRDTINSIRNYYPHWPYYTPGGGTQINVYESSDGYLIREPDGYERRFDRRGNPYSRRREVPIAAYVGVGFNETANPSIGARFGNIGLEVGGVFNQDRLAENRLDYPALRAPGFVYNDLGERRLTSQWGIDVLGHAPVSRQVSLYGGVGLYFQQVGVLAQSPATNSIYTESQSTRTTTAFSGGADFQIGEGTTIGVGYHSVRGVQARVGVSF
jgi:hypothetical protein